MKKIDENKFFSNALRIENFSSNKQATTEIQLFIIQFRIKKKQEGKKCRFKKKEKEKNLLFQLTFNRRTFNRQTYQDQYQNRVSR